MLFFYGHVAGGLSCVAVLMDENQPARGEVRAAGVGATNEEASQRCCAILTELGYDDCPVGPQTLRAMLGDE